MRQLAYLSLGSNVGNRSQNLHDAIARLATVGEIVAVSSLYETEPVELIDQGWFLNCAVILRTEHGPEDLMQELLRIEREMGRTRTREKGPRTIDIDIVLFGDLVMQSEKVTIPHPAMHERRFVLLPLAEIAPEAQHPIFHRSLGQLLEALPSGQEVRRYLGA